MYHGGDVPVCQLDVEGRNLRTWTSMRLPSGWAQGTDGCDSRRPVTQTAQPAAQICKDIGIMQHETIYLWKHTVWTLKWDFKKVSRVPLAHFRWSRKVSVRGDKNHAKYQQMKTKTTFIFKKFSIKVEPALLEDRQKTLQGVDAQGHKYSQLAQNHSHICSLAQSAQCKHKIHFGKPL